MSPPFLGDLICIESRAYEGLRRIVNNHRRKDDKVPAETLRIFLHECDHYPEFLKSIGVEEKVESSELKKATYYIDINVVRDLKIFAAKKDRTASDVVMSAIKEYLLRHK